jgi:hypothetical protein
MKYKRTRSTIFYKIKRGLGAGAKVFGSLFGACAAAFAYIEISGEHIEPKYVFIILATIGSISLIVSFIKGHISHLADTIIFDNDHDLNYELHYETKVECAFFNRETSQYFGRDFVDDRIVEDWRTKNPQGFLFLKNEHNDACAALCVFALTPSFMEQFIKGRLAEYDLEESDVLSLQDAKKSDSLYLATIIVCQPNSTVGHRRTLALIWGLNQYIKKVYGLRKKRTLYTVPINVASENLVKRLGFQLVGLAQSRKDKHNLYSLELNKTNILVVEQRIGDYSNICSLKI